MSQADQTMPAPDGAGPDHPALPGWVIALPECPSTNTWALERLEALAHGACVWTRRQSAGRGRDGRRWHAPPGVLTASWILTGLGPPLLGRLALAAGLAVAHAVEDAAPGVRIQLKWPNDCLLRGRKLAGVLCEAGPGAVVVGIGLNLDPRWEADPAALPLAVGRIPPIGLSEVHQPPPGELAMLAGLRRYLLEAAGLIAAGHWPRLLPELRARDALIGARIRVSTPRGPREGLAAGLDDSGRLLLRDGARLDALASASAVERLG